MCQPWQATVYTTIKQAILNGFFDCLELMIPSIILLCWYCQLCWSWCSGGATMLVTAIVYMMTMTASSRHLLKLLHMHNVALEILGTVILWFSDGTDSTLLLVGM
jgi:hypothetical protein